MKMKQFIPYVIALLIPMFSACIDEDLSDCPPPEQTFVVDYQIDLTTEVDPQYNVRLQNLHLGFWNTPTNLFEANYFDASNMPEKLFFTIDLPVKDYEHIAVGNRFSSENPFVQFPQDINQFFIKGEYVEPNTIKAFQNALLVGSKRIALASQSDIMHYRVLLRPVASRVQVKVNKPASMTNLRCKVSGTMEGYKCWQDAYLVNDKLMTDASAYVKQGTAGQSDVVDFYCFPTVGEPLSQKNRQQKAVDGNWKIYFYTDCKGKVVQHVFTITTPLEAGMFFEGEFNLTEQGGNMVNADAAVEVDTDWHPGDEFDQDV